MSIENISEDRKKSFAVFFALLIIFTWMQLNQQARPVPPQTTEVKTDVVAETHVATQNTIIKNQPAGDQIAPVNALPELSEGLTVDYASAPKLTIESPQYIAKFNLLGGRLESWKLKKYFQTVSKKESLDLITTTGENAPLAVELGSLSDATSLYQIMGSSKEPSNNKITLAAGEELNLKLQGTLANGLSVDKSFKFEADSYLFDVNVDLSQATKDGSKLELEWYDHLNSDFSSDRYNIKSVFHKPGDSGIEREVVDGKSHELVQTTGQYVGLGDNYFMSTFVALNGLASVKHQTVKDDQDTLVNYSLFGDSKSLSAKVYIGPKDPDILKVLGYDLSKSIDLGWFSFIGQPINLLIAFFFNLLGNYGLAIILVTVLIKLLLLPLTKKSYLSMSAMSKLQPQMAALRERVKDPAVLQQEMLKLYQKNGVNPLGGCLPMVLQIPIFLGMYNTLKTSVYLRHASFALWVDDLASPERLMMFGIPVPVMILLMGTSMFFQTMLTPTAADPNQKKIMYLMPVMFTVMFIIFPFPSGLVLYWLVNNVMSIIQQYAIRTERNIQPLPATVVAGVTVFGIGYVLTLFS